MIFKLDIIFWVSSLKIVHLLHGWLLYDDISLINGQVAIWNVSFTMSSKGNLVSMQKTYQPEGHIF